MKTWLCMLVTLMAVSFAPAAEEVLDAANLDAIRAKSGNNAVIEGQVTEIGTTKDGGITFINVGLPKKQGFVAIVFRDYYSVFPDGFDKFRNQKIRVSGVVKLYRGETPQIELRTADQIAIVTP